MKKYISLLALALVFGLTTSCDSDPSDSNTSAGGTSVKKMAGSWIVTAYMCEEPGEIDDIDNWAWDEIGEFEAPLQTYNTAANKATEMWLDDQEELYLGDGLDYTCKVKVDVNYGKRTFSVKDADNMYSDEKITVIGGKVLKNAARNEDNVKVDSIVYYLNTTTSGLGYIKVSGHRNHI